MNKLFLRDLYMFLLCTATKVEKNNVGKMNMIKLNKYTVTESFVI